LSRANKPKGNKKGNGMFNKNELRKVQFNAAVTIGLAKAAQATEELVRCQAELNAALAELATRATSEGVAEDEILGRLWGKIFTLEAAIRQMKDLSSWANRYATSVEKLAEMAKQNRA